MRMAIYRDDKGEIVLGVPGSCGLMPVLVWRTWAEYMAFVEGMNEFVEKTYKADVMKQSLIGYINSIKEIDTL